RMHPTQLVPRPCEVGTRGSRSEDFAGRDQGLARKTARPCPSPRTPPRGGSRRPLSSSPSECRAGTTSWMQHHVVTALAESWTAFVSLYLSDAHFSAGLIE